MKNNKTKNKEFDFSHLPDIINGEKIQKRKDLLKKHKTFTRKEWKMKREEYLKIIEDYRESKYNTISYYSSLLILCLYSQEPLFWFSSLCFICIDIILKESKNEEI